MNTAWLAQLANAHHDGTTQQIDDFVQAFQTDNAVLTQKKATLHQARQTEDEVWLKEQRDAAVPQLEAADRHAGADAHRRAQRPHHPAEGYRTVCSPVLPERRRNRRRLRHGNVRGHDIGFRLDIGQRRFDRQRHTCAA